MNGKREKFLTFISRILRWATLGSLLAFVLAATMLHTLGYVGPSIHALCPYGGLESMLTLVTVGTFLKRIVIGTFVLFGSTVLLAVFMRRSFCGQICAFGGLQEFFGKIGNRLFKKRPVVPQKLDRVLRYLKYVVLAVTVGMAWITGELWITPYDPFNALGHLADFNTLVTSYLVGFIVLLITLIGSIVYDRFFCKYLCPAGALYGIIGKASPYAVRIEEDACIRCGKCSRSLPDEYRRDEREKRARHERGMHQLQRVRRRLPGEGRNPHRILEEAAHPPDRGDDPRALPLLRPDGHRGGDGRHAASAE